tara:strand:+ start:1799 stop:1981 length:183 start_codon:yes stop_codon:yes gene_type:complete
LIKDSIYDDIKFTNLSIHTIKEDEGDDDYDDDVVKRLNWEVMREKCMMKSMERVYMRIFG